MTQLKAARRAKGLTQMQLAERSGVDQRTISRIEAGRVQRPSHEVVVRICRALKVNPQTVAEFHVARGQR